MIVLPQVITLQEL